MGDHAAEPAITVHQLRKTFHRGRGAKRTALEAVDGISFTVERGERLAYIGPNGAGKSTSIKILTGILHPSSGDAVVLGVVPWKERRRLATRIGTLFGQRSMLWTELAPRQSLHMLAAMHGMDRHAEHSRVGELAELLDAADLLDQPIRTQSLGQRMRCELMAAMLHRPEVLFLDEPTIGLDLLAKQRFRELLVRVNVEKGTTVFLTSHDIADIEQVADRAIVINHGRVIEDGAVATMRQRFLATRRIEVGLTQPIEAPTLDGVSVDEHTDAVLRLSVDTKVTSVRRVLDALLDGPAVSDVSVVDPPLEDVIAEIYRSPRR